jgi:hypothetical protein
MDSMERIKYDVKYCLGFHTLLLGTQARVCDTEEKNLGIVALYAVKPMSPYRRPISLHSEYPEICLCLFFNGCWFYSLCIRQVFGNMI